MNKICRRDGELPVTLEFAGVRVEMSVSEFRTLLMCALNDFAQGSGVPRRILQTPVELLIESADLLCALSPKTTKADDAANLARYHATGVGGTTDMRELIAALAEWKKRLTPDDFLDAGSRLIEPPA